MLGPAGDLAAAASTLRQLLEARAALTAPPLTVEAGAARTFLGSEPRPHGVMGR